MSRASEILENLHKVTDIHVNSLHNILKDHGFKKENGEYAHHSGHKIRLDPKHDKGKVGIMHTNPYNRSQPHNYYSNVHPDTLSKILRDHKVTY